MRNIFFAPLFLIASISFADSAPGVVYAGNKAEVTIVEFGDFQCLYCKRANESLKQVVATYGDKVRIVFRNSPLDIHQEAKPAAAAGLCADEQGKFADMFNYLYANQDTLSHDTYLAGARAQGLDLQKFETCLTADTTARQIERDIATGKELKVLGTPSFFLSRNSKTVRLVGAYPFQDFQKAIDELLKN